MSKHDKPGTQRMRELSIPGAPEAPALTTPPDCQSPSVSPAGAFRVLGPAVTVKASADPVALPAETKTYLRVVAMFGNAHVAIGGEDVKAADQDLLLIEGIPETIALPDGATHAAAFEGIGQRGCYVNLTPIEAA